MPRLFEKYRFRDGVTPLSEETFNRILSDIDLRIATLEGLQVDWEQALSTITGQGLDRVAQAMSGPLAELTATVADLAAQIESAQQTGMLLDAPGTVTDSNLGDRTLSDATAPTSNTGALTVLLGGLGNRLKAITGEANWRNVPATTLTAVATAVANSAHHLANMTNPHQTTASQVGALPIGGGTLTGPVNVNNNNLVNIKLLGDAAEYNCGAAGSGITVALANGMQQKVSVSQSCTLTISTTNAVPGRYRLRIVTAASSTITITWSGLATARWLGATSAPAIRYGASGYESLLELFYDGVNITQRLTKIGAV